VSGLLEARQADLVSLISESESSYGRISQVTFVAIAFLIPAMTIVVFWFVLRQKMKTREARMRGIVEKERDLNRAKDELIAGLSHELRTPITSILGFSEILLEDPGVHNEAHELIELINASSSDLSRMVNDLLVAARIDAGALTMDLAEVNLSDEVRAVVTVYRRSGENIDVNVPPIRVHADALRVRQAIHNLISNALRHGGSQVSITASETAQGPVLVVADNGPGLPADMVGKAFERFAHKGRQAVVAGSVGLGLAICKELAAQMGGDLEYQRDDGWTRFHLRLRPYKSGFSRKGSLLPMDEPTGVGS
jgi:signal transduction histidine kinase